MKSIDSPVAIDHEHNAADTLSQLLHTLDGILHSGDYDLPENTRQQLEGAYKSALNDIGTSFINAPMGTLPLAKVASYELPDNVTLEAVKGRQDVIRWALRDRIRNCLNKEGEWEYEPQPSSRDDDFYARCRWATKEDAYQAWETLVFSKQATDPTA